MRRNLLYWISCLSIVLSISACGQNENEPENKDATPVTGMTEKMADNKKDSSSYMNNRNEADNPAMADIDFLHPEMVVQAMLTAAKHGDIATVMSLCDEDAKRMNDPNSLCNGNAMLMQKLATAHIADTKDIKLSKLTARVPIAYTDGNTKSDVVLALRKDKWYISGVENLK